MSPKLPPEQRIWFNGRDCRAEIPAADGLNFGAADFSLLTTFKAMAAESENKRRYLLNKGKIDEAHYSLFLNERGQLLFETGTREADGIYRTAAKAGRPIIAGRFHTVAAVRDSSGKLALYLDGKPAAEYETGLTGSVDNDRDPLIGGGEEGGWFQGEIASVRLFDRSLTALEIAGSARIDGALLDLGDSDLSGPDAEGTYNWTDKSERGNFVVLRAEIIKRYPFADRAVPDEQAPGLTERLPPELRKAAPLRELFEALDEYWRDKIDGRASLLGPRSVFEASDEDINLRLEELTTYSDEYSREKARPLSIVWKKEEIKHKNSAAAFEALLRRFKIPLEYIAYTPLYCKKNETYGETFYSADEIDDRDIDDYFLSSHVELKVDHKKILGSEFDKNDLRKALERHFEDNVRPAHIVFRGLSFHMKETKCRLPFISALSRKRRIRLSRLEGAVGDANSVEADFRSLSAAAQGRRICRGRLDEDGSAAF